MKTLFTYALLCLTVSFFAQDTEKDTVQLNDYGARIYNARIERDMSITLIASQNNNPYKFTSTNDTMQTELYTLIDVDKSIKEKAKLLIEQAIKSKNITALFGKTAICGPILWNKYLTNGGDKNVKGIDIKFHLTNDKSQQTIIGKAIQTDSGFNFVWKFVLKTSSKYNLRKPSKRELTAYANLLSPNISEPIYVIDIGNINYLIHIDYRNMTLLFIDQLQ